MSADRTPGAMDHPTLTEQLTASSAHALRDRAEQLRRLAIRLDQLSVHSLPAHAGYDTWESPRVELCRELLRTNLDQLVRAGADLRRAAHQLEERAARESLMVPSW